MGHVTYKLDPTTIARIVNILQEAILTGMDISVLFSEMELEPSDDGCRLVMTERYRSMVQHELDRMTAGAEERAADELIKKARDDGAVG